MYSLEDLTRLRVSINFTLNLLGYFVENKICHLWKRPISYTVTDIFVVF